MPNGCQLSLDPWLTVRDIITHGAGGEKATRLHTGYKPLAVPTTEQNYQPSVHDAMLNATVIPFIGGVPLLSTLAQDQKFRVCPNLLKRRVRLIELMSLICLVSPPLFSFSL